MQVRPRVSVRVGVHAPAEAAKKRSRMVVVGVVDAGSVHLAELYPRAVVRTTRPTGDEGVEHLRFQAGADLSGLPGLDGAFPSRLRDTVALAFEAGAPAVEVLLARGAGRRPSDLWHDAMVGLLEPFIDQLPGTAVLMPDAIGPARVDRRQIRPEMRLLNLSAVVRRWRGSFAANFQIGFFDMPFAARARMEEALASISAGDVVLCSWEGVSGNLLRHGWRSAAAVSASLCMSSSDPTAVIEGRVTELAGGRTVSRPRWGELGVPEAAAQVPPTIAPHVMRLGLSRGGRTVRVLSEPTMRAPRGSWSLPLMRTAKLLHHRIVVAADAFVFDKATPDRALALSTALRMAVEPFVERQLVTGPEGREDPDILTFASPDPAQPALIAQVGLFLRPWLRELRFNVAVRPGETPQLEVF